MSSRKAAALALTVGWALWLCVAGAAAHAAESETAGAKAEQVEKKVEQAESAKADGPVAESEDEKALLERARAYWDSRVVGSSKAYEFYPPDVRERGPLPGEFVGVLYRNYEIERVLTEGDLGVVIVRAQQLIASDPTARVQAGKFEKQLRAHIGEEWVRAEGTWYKKPVYGGLSRFMHPRDARESVPVKSENPRDAGGDVPGNAGP